MKWEAALLLTILLGINPGSFVSSETHALPKLSKVEPIVPPILNTSPPIDQNKSISTIALTSNTPIPEENEPTTNEPITNTTNLSEYMQLLLNPKDILLQEIRSLDEEATNERLQKELMKSARTGSLKPQKDLLTYSHDESSSTSSSTNKTVSTSTSTENLALQELLEAEDMTYNDDLDEEDDNDDDEYDDDDDDDDDEEDDIVDEGVITQCPEWCKCIGQYAAATTARCSKFVEGQSFGLGITHLRVENGDEIHLGPHALRTRGLQQLESINFIDTPITEFDRTAFDGLPYLFAVNLTRNGLTRIPPDSFHNNTQLSLLTISGNPLQYSKLKGKPYYRYLLDAPSVTELDFSVNELPQLSQTSFIQMPNLVYINLKGNKLKTIERAIFNPLDSLLELDLSNNQLSDLPQDVFNDTELQTLRISGNNLTTLATIKAVRLTTLDASRNRIKIVAKDDLIDVPYLDQLIISSNGLKRIHQHAFANLDELTYLDISDNKLTSLTEHHLRTNARLQILLMNDNPGLETLPVFKLGEQEGFNSYSVYRLECAGCGLYYLEEGTFNTMPALTRLNLARNRLTGLPKGLLADMLSLRELDLSDNMIGTLETNMFVGATSLSKLNLAGNRLVALQVAPFLATPNLSRLDVSRCFLERVWNEARMPLKSLKFLSVRGNLLQRITVEELKATPKLSGLDISHNPLICDKEFNEAVQWLTEHGVTSTEILRYINNYSNAEDYAEAESVSQWTDLARLVCNGINDGPPPRPVPHKPNNDVLTELQTPRDSDPVLRINLDGDQIDHGQRSDDDEIEDVWLNQDQEYEDYSEPSRHNYRPWYGGALWPVITVILVTLAIVLLVAHCAVCLAKRKGRGPVIRAPMILRQGLIDNKNCGLVYKPLQEEIATPHMAKRGSFYSSSTFHYDKIVPESV